MFVTLPISLSIYVINILMEIRSLNNLLYKPKEHNKKRFRRIASLILKKQNRKRKLQDIDDDSNKEVSSIAVPDRA